MSHNDEVVTRMRFWFLRQSGVTFCYDRSVDFYGLKADAETLCATPADGRSAIECLRELMAIAEAG